ARERRVERARKAGVAREERFVSAADEHDDRRRDARVRCELALGALHRALVRDALGGRTAPPAETRRLRPANDVHRAPGRREIFRRKDTEERAHAACFITWNVAIDGDRLHGRPQIVSFRDIHTGGLELRGRRKGYAAAFLADEERAF